MNSPIEEIKRRLDIVDLISSYLKLQKCGRNYRALCPFHSEKKPSFFVSPSLQIFKCFGCGKSGDIFKFIMELERVEFREALKILAEKANVELKPLRPEIVTEKERLYEINEWATLFFQTQLKKSKKGKEIRNYLIKRGINEDSIERWKLGYAPDSQSALSEFLISKGFKENEIVRAGLAIFKKDKSLKDRFRKRIIFPIFDINGLTVGFGGRISPEAEDKDLAKYINIPNTLLYKKSQILYGINEAKFEIREKNFVILAEGYTDVILAHQRNFKNTVGISGTSLTENQLRVLKRFTENIYTAFDADIGGDFATRRGIDIAQREGFEIKIIDLPKDKDPADLLSKNPQIFKDLVKKAKSITRFYFERAFRKFRKRPFSPLVKKKIAQLIIPVIGRIPNKIEQAGWIKKLADKLEVPEESVFLELKKIKSEEKPIEEKELVFEKDRKELLEEKILSIFFQLKKEGKFFEINKFDKEYLSLKGRKILKALKEERTPDEIKEDILTLKLRSEVYPEKEPEKELPLCLKEIKKIVLKERLAELSEKIKKAKKKKDSSLDKLLEKFNNLTRKLAQL